MFIVTVTFTAKPETVDAFREAILQHARNCLEKELGCRQFDVSVSPDDPCVFFIYEVYDDETAFDIHRTSAHSAWCRATIADLVEDRDLRTWRQIDHRADR